MTRIEPTPEDAALAGRWVSRLVRWMRAREAATGQAVSVAQAVGIARNAAQDYLHFGRAP